MKANQVARGTGGAKPPEKGKGAPSSKFSMILMSVSIRPKFSLNPGKGKGKKGKRQSSPEPAPVLDMCLGQSTSPLKRGFSLMANSKHFQTYWFQAWHGHGRTEDARHPRLSCNRHEWNMNRGSCIDSNEISDKWRNSVFFFQRHPIRSSNLLHDVLKDVKSMWIALHRWGCLEGKKGHVQVRNISTYPCKTFCTTRFLGGRWWKISPQTCDILFIHVECDDMWWSSMSTYIYIYTWKINLNVSHLWIFQFVICRNI